MHIKKNKGLNHQSAKYNRSEILGEKIVKINYHFCNLFMNFSNVHSKDTLGHTLTGVNKEIDFSN